MSFLVVFQVRLERFDWMLQEPRCVGGEPSRIVGGGESAPTFLAKPDIHLGMPAKPVRQTLRHQPSLGKHFDPGRYDAPDSVQKQWVMSTT